MGVSRSESDRHGGPEHRYWVKRMAEQLSATGYKVAEEVPVGGGKAIDLVATKDGQRIGFEIETGKSDAAANVRKCLDAGMDRVVIVATSADVRSRLARKLRPHPSVDLLTGSEAIKWLAER